MIVLTPKRDRLRSTFPEEMVQDVTPPPPVQYRLKGLYYFSKHILTPLHRHVDLDTEQILLQKRLDDFRLRCWREAQVVAYNRCTEMAYFMFTPLATLAGRILAGDHHWFPMQIDQADGTTQSRLINVAGLALVVAAVLLLFSIVPAQIKHDVPHQVWGYLAAVLFSILIGVAMSDDHEPLHESFDLYTNAGLRYVPLLYALGTPLVIAAQLFHFRQELTYNEDEIDYFEWQTAVRALRKKGHLDMNKPTEAVLDKFLKRGFRNLLNTRIARHEALKLPTTITQQQVDAVCASRESWASWFDTINDVEPVASLDLSWLWWRLAIPVVFTALWSVVSRALWQIGIVALDGAVLETWSTEWWVRNGVDWAPITLLAVSAVIIWIATELRSGAQLPDAETHSFLSYNRFVQAQFSGIVGPYKIEKFWYEALEYFRKATMTVGLCMLKPGSTEQLFAATVASCLFLCCAVWIEPHENNSLNRTKIACEMVTLLVFLAAIAARVNLSASIAQSGDECVVALGRGEFSLQDWAAYLEWALSRGMLWMLFAFVVILESKQLTHASMQVLVHAAHLLRVLGFASFESVEQTLEEGDPEDQDGCDESEDDEAAGAIADSKDSLSNSQDSLEQSGHMLSTEEMAVKIQKWWRGARARRTLQELTRQQPVRGVNRFELAKAILSGWGASVLLTASLWLTAFLSQPEDELSCQCAQYSDQPLTAWPTATFAYFLVVLWFLGGLVGASVSYYQQGTWLPHVQRRTQYQVQRDQKAKRQRRADEKAKALRNQAAQSATKDFDVMDLERDAQNMNPLAELQLEPEPQPEEEDITAT
eukprot:COSAG02_NODE_850_length_16538_cov_55.923231_4_plen_821_part_00